MKKIIVSYDPTNRTEPTVILGDKLEIGTGCARILAGEADTVVAHVQNYAWIAFEENRPAASRVLDIRATN